MVHATQSRATALLILVVKTRAGSTVFVWRKDTDTSVTHVIYIDSSIAPSYLNLRYSGCAVRSVALQVAFERQTLKPDFHLIVFRVWV